MEESTVVTAQYSSTQPIPLNVFEISQTGLSQKWEPISEMLKINISINTLAEQVIEIRNLLEDSKRGISAIISDLGSSKYLLKQPLSLIITKEEGFYYAELVDAEIYGEGRSEKDAVQNLKENFIIFYEGLKSPRKKLSSLMQAKLNWLNKIIE